MKRRSPCRRQRGPLRATGSAPARAPRCGAAALGAPGPRLPGSRRRPPADECSSSEAARILGVATARELVCDHGVESVVLLEKEAALGRHQSGHNSGVVHAGIYYAAGSLKARLCRSGGDRLRAFCAAQGLTYDECGKVVVARTAGELEALGRLEERAGANGVPGLARLDEAALHAVEPAVRGVAALHSPHTAIVDFGAVHVRGARRRVRRGRGARLRLRAPRRRQRSRTRRPRHSAARRRIVRSREIVRSSARACTPTSSHARLARARRRGSCRSAASTGSCGRSAAASCAASSTRSPTPRCRFSAFT